MQLTIDSAESLDKVLEVVGALYGVRLEPQQSPVAEQAEQSAPPSRRAASSRSTTRAATAETRERRSSGRTTRATQTLDQQAVRAWARANGRAVSNRGRLPRDVLKAYQQAVQA